MDPSITKIHSFRKASSSPKHIGPAAIFVVVITIWVWNWALSAPMRRACTVEELGVGQWSLREIDGATWPRLKDSAGYTCSDNKHALKCYLNNESDYSELARVAKSTSYEWVPTGCAMRPLDSAALAKKMASKAREHGVEGGILFVGDSITMQHAQSFECLMGREVSFGVIGDTTVSGLKLGKAGAIDFVRSDYLSDPDTNHVVLPEEVPRADAVIYDQKWTQYLAGKSYVVINSGAHWGSFEDWNIARYKDVAEQTLAIIEKYAPHIHLIFRSSVPGHQGCSVFDAPLETSDPDLHSQYNWMGFVYFNKVWEDLLAGHPRHLYMDVGFTGLRGDGHRLPDKDCLHYCLPGPVDAWTVMLGHLIHSL